MYIVLNATTISTISESSRTKIQLQSITYVKFSRSVFKSQ